MAEVNPEIMKAFSVSLAGLNESTRMSDVLAVADLIEMARHHDDSAHYVSGRSREILISAGLIEDNTPNGGLHESVRQLVLDIFS